MTIILFFNMNISKCAVLTHLYERNVVFFQGLYTLK